MGIHGHKFAAMWPSCNPTVRLLFTSDPSRRTRYAYSTEIMIGFIKSISGFGFLCVDGFPARSIRISCIVVPFLVMATDVMQQGTSSERCADFEGGTVRCRYYVDAMVI